MSVLNRTRLGQWLSQVHGGGKMVTQTAGRIRKHIQALSFFSGNSLSKAVLFGAFLIGP